MATDVSTLVRRANVVDTDEVVVQPTGNVPPQRLRLDTLIAATPDDDSVGPDQIDADTAAKKAAINAELATGRLQKSVAGSNDVTLTADEAAYDSVEFTGALTGAIVVTLPTAPSGLRAAE